MTDIGDIIFDSDGVYIRIKDHQVNFSDPKTQAVADDEAEKIRRRKMAGKQAQFGEEDGDDVDESSFHEIAASQGVGESMVKDLQSLKVWGCVLVPCAFL